MSLENPQKSPPKITCELCYYNTSNKKDYNKHLITAKHKNRSFLANLGEKIPKNPQKSKVEFTCELCYYNTTNKKDYNKHLNRSKHKKNEQEKEKQTLQSLLPTIVDTSSNDVKLLTGLVVELVKSNSDLQKQMLEICKNSNSHSHNTNNSHNTTTTTNSHNKTFNLQFFLNEECKDAMNLSEFINSIQPKLSDLENIGKLGYVQGISNIIIKQLNETQVTKRPVHCSDAKRETLYVKEEDKWEKDTDETKKMVKAVKDVSKKTSNLLITEWKDKHPKFMDSESKDCKDFKNLAGKIYDGDEANVNKVVKKVAKEVVIDK